MLEEDSLEETTLETALEAALLAFVSPQPVKSKAAMPDKRRQRFFLLLMFFPKEAIRREQSNALEENSFRPTLLF
jgi:hypothetical protein